jgi:hypothetical protein
MKRHVRMKCTPKKRAGSFSYSHLSHSVKSVQSADQVQVHDDEDDDDDEIQKSVTGLSVKNIKKREWSGGLTVTLNNSRDSESATVSMSMTDQ